MMCGTVNVCAVVSKLKTSVFFFACVRNTSPVTTVFTAVQKTDICPYVALISSCPPHRPHDCQRPSIISSKHLADLMDSGNIPQACDNSQNSFGARSAYTERVWGANCVTDIQVWSLRQKQRCRKYRNGSYENFFFEAGP